MFELDTLNEDVFTEEQLEALNTPLTPEEIETKHGDLQYLKGQYAIAKANRIFGIGNWGYEQIGPLEMIETVTSNNNNKKVVLVTAMVKVTVKGAISFVEQGDCEAQGEGYASLSMARKGAVTDGVKRCLKNFGPAFGLELYLGKQLKNARRPAQTFGGNYNNRPAAQQNQTAPAPAPAQAPKQTNQTQPTPAPQSIEKITRLQKEAILQKTLRISDSSMAARVQQLYNCTLEELTFEDAKILIKAMENAGTKQTQPQTQGEAPQPPDGKTSSWCQECGSEAVWKSGVDENGKPWGGYKCTDKTCGKMLYVELKQAQAKVTK